MKIYEHMEAHLGPIARGWGPAQDTLGIQVSLFEHVPEKGLNTFSTLGLNRYVLSIGQKQVRQELLFSALDTYAADDIASFLMTFAESVASSHKGLLRGEVVVGESLIEGITINEIYASIPVFWSDKMHVFNDSSPSTVFVWLLPIHKAEADVIALKGWNYFEGYLEEAEADLWDLNRASLF